MDAFMHGRAEVYCTVRIYGDRLQVNVTWWRHVTHFLDAMRERLNVGLNLGRGACERPRWGRVVLQTVQARVEIEARLVHVRWRVLWDHPELVQIAQFALERRVGEEHSAASHDHPTASVLLPVTIRHLHWRHYVREHFHLWAQLAVVAAVRLGCHWLLHAPARRRGYRSLCHLVCLGSRLERRETIRDGREPRHRTCAAFEVSFVVVVVILAANGVLLTASTPREERARAPCSVVATVARFPEQRARGRTPQEFFSPRFLHARAFAVARRYVLQQLGRV